ncbi:MAG TPA: NrfD/PsrC family molybdoenzyme membrane anchor subunit [Solirubrobacteraceae bacterium]|nr:NrfD/PsrC family molybdoenzyme membrane anchor subunit [Solirubrobacteraceae bacterium]
MTAPGESAPTQGQTTVSGVAPRQRRGGERSMVPPGEPRSYYGQPVLAKPVWSKEIPLYFWVGGIAGASAPLALVASLSGNDELARRAQGAALAGALISPVLLIKDLGKPMRFFNMLRVFKVTSPMSVGSWILSGFSAAVTLGAAREFTDRLPRLGRTGQVAGLLLGPGLSTYTAALIANTAVPAWHDARGELPYVFATSSLATAGGLATALTPPRSAGPARRLTVAGAVAELVVTQVMERRLSERVGAAYHHGRPQQLLRAAKALNAAGAMAVAASRGRRPAATAGGLAVLAGGLLARWGIFAVGVASAQDPKATVGPQRDRLHRRPGTVGTASAAGSV